MKKITKVLMLLAPLIIFSFAGKAQTLDFQLSVDTVFENQTLQIYNSSTGFSASNRYKFEFNPCQFYETGSGNSCTLTKDLNDTITGYFSGNFIDSVTISLFALDSLGNQLSYTAKTTTIIVLTPKFPIWTIDSCHENINICQNLVCNGDFEWYFDTVYASALFYLAQPWNDYGFTTSDYYNEITTTSPLFNDAGIPNNYNGYQYDKFAANGNKAYAGSIAWDGSGQCYREYLISQLKDTLIAGQRYNVSLDISLSDTSRYATNGIQVLFTDTMVTAFISPNKYILPNWSTMNNLVDAFGDTVVNDNVNWTAFNAVFIPDSNNLNWISIGNFKPDSNVIIDTVAMIGYLCSYYYIDNILVYPLPPDITITGDTTLCAPNSVSVTLKAIGTGAASYLWSNSSTADSIVVTPTVTTTYYVTTTDYHACNSVVDSATIYILPSQLKPNVWVNNDTVCGDIDSAYLVVQGTGAIGYLWSNSDTTNSISVFPTTTTTYTVTVFGNYSPCNDTVLTAIVFTAYQGLSGQSISGNIYTCDTISTYTIINYDTNLIYVWTIDDIILDTIPYNQFQINWLNNINTGKGDTIKVIMREPYCDRIEYMYLKILPCCMPDSVDMVWTDSILNSSHPNFDSTNNQLEFFNEIISINDTLTIDDNTYFDNCEIYLGPEATIIINQADSLEFNNSLLMACDSFMWNGIFLDDTTRHLSITNNSIVKDAMNAVVSTNGGRLSLINSIFSNNYKNVHISDYSPIVQTLPWPQTSPAPIEFKGYIAGCDFIGGALFNNPANKTSTHSGIEANNVFGLIVGDNNQQLTNNFSLMKYGIKSYFSDITIINNTFTDIFYSSPNSFTGATTTIAYTVPEAAIYAVYSYSPWVASPNVTAITPKLIIGGSNNLPNTFTNCNAGVFALNHKVEISNDTFDVRFGGIIIDNIKNHSEILNNYISISKYAGPGVYSGIGIGVKNVNKTSRDLYICENEITVELDAKQGIWVQNCASHIDTSILTTVIGNNKVIFDKDFSGNYHNFGLRFDNCDRAVIINNQVDNLNSVPQNYNRVYGISTGDCKNASVTKNYPINRMGTGIRVVGDNVGTQYFCNSMYDCNIGFYFVHGNGVATYISDQGDSTWSSDNLWNNFQIANQRVMGKLNLDSVASVPQKINWYFVGNGYTDMQPFNPQIPITVISWFNEQPGLNYMASCWTGIPNPIPNPNNSTLRLIREERFGEIVRDEIEWEQLYDEFSYFNGDYVWEEFDYDSNWVYLGAEDDIVYQNFYEYIMNNTNIDEFAEIREMIDNGELVEAMIENSGIVPNNTIDINRSFVNAAYLNYYVQEKAVPDDTLTSLWQIAMLTPWIGGDAVYSARILLGIDPHEYQLPYRLMDTTNRIVKNSYVNVYPNPANDLITFELNSAANSQLKIEIYNILGMKINSWYIPEGEKLLSISLKTLPNGVYLYKLSGVQTIENPNGRFIKK